MGKGSRSRLNRLQEEVGSSQTAVKKKKQNKSGGKSVVVMTIIVAVVVLFVVAAIVLSALSNQGTFLRAKTVLSSEHYKIDATMMTYFMQYTYEQWYSQWGNYVSSYFSLNTQATWKSQSFGLGTYDSMLGYESNANSTWFDYFADLSVSSAKNILLYAEAALADPDYDSTLTQEDKDSIQSNISDMKSMYELYKSYYEAMGSSYYESFRAYLTAVYGKGVREADITRMMELQKIASKYYEYMQNKLGEANRADTDRIQTCFEENSDSYLTADYLTYTFKATLNKPTKEDDQTDEEYNAAVAEANEKFAEEKAKAQENAAALAASADETAFETWLREYFAETIELAEGDNLEDKVNAEYEKCVKTDATFSSSSELGCWILGYVYDKDAAADSEPEKTEKAAKGSVKMIESDSEESYSATIYCVTREASLKDIYGVNVEIALFNKDSTFKGPEEDAESVDAATAATKFLETYQTVASTKDMDEVLNELGYTNAYHAGYEHMTHGDCDFEEVEDWAFDEAKAGDMTTLSVSYTSDSTTTEYICIAYLKSVDELKEWQITVARTLTSNDLTSWHDGLAENTTINYNESSINAIAK